MNVIEQSFAIHTAFKNLKAPCILAAKTPIHLQNVHVLFVTISYTNTPLILHSHVAINV